MNRSVFFSTLIGLGCMFTAACTSTSVVEEPIVPETEAPVSFRSAVTRAVVDADKENLQIYGVWGGFDGKYNLFDGESVQPDGSYNGVRYWVNGKVHNFYALHPHPDNGGLPAAGVTCGQDGDGAFTISSYDAALNRGEHAVDLMTAQCTGLNYTTGETPPPVGFTFRHELAWVEFEIKAAQAVTIDFIRLRGIVYQGDISLTPGTTSYEASWSKLVRSDADTGEPFAEGTVDIPQDKTNQSIFLLGGNLLLPPQDLTDQQVFTMKWTYTGMEGETRTVNVKMPLAGVSSWEKGKHYVYSAVIPPTPVDITFNVSVKKWKKTTVSADL